MAKIFHVVEVVDLGIEKEKARRDFYDRVANYFAQSEMKDLFTRLRDWEAQHIEKFTEIRDSLPEPEPVDSYPGEMALYMQSLVDDKLYKDTSPQEFGRRISSPLIAIQYGMGFERDAILFFNELLPHVGSSNADAIQQLINEEKQHLVYLAELKKKFES